MTAHNVSNSDVLLITIVAANFKEIAFPQLKIN